MSAMKTLCVVLTLLLSLNGKAVAQRREAPLREGQEELGLAVGFASVQLFIAKLTDLIVVAGSAGFVAAESHDPVGPITLSYDRYSSDLFSYGLEASYFSIEQDYASTISGDTLLTTRNHYYVLMGRADLRWGTLGPVEFSSGLALGPALYSQALIGSDTTGSASAVLPAFQLSALRLRIGTQIGVFGELGFGFRGSAVLGVSGRF